MDVVNGQMGIDSGQRSLVLGIDPGRDKTGFAVVDFDGALVFSGIFPSSEREKFFSSIMNNNDLSDYITEGSYEAFNVKFIIIGNGTHSREFYDYMKENLPYEILTVDERNTTIEARALYWTIHEPKLFMRLLPKSMRVPERVLDDLAAWSIALRGLKKYRDITANKL